MMRITLTAALTGLLLSSAAQAQTGAAAGEAPQFFETPGVLEFSGYMTARPLQVDAWMSQGYSRQEAEILNDNATERLLGWAKEYVPETDETVFRVPEGHDENSIAAWLLETGDYQYVEPDWTCYPVDQEPNDPAYGSQWHHQKMKSWKAWDFGFGDGQFIACTVDTGVDLDHPDLQDALVSGYNSASRTSQANGGNVNDINGHGTATIGCVGAIGNNDYGVAGMAWDIKLMPVRCTNRSNGSASLSDLTNGARWASDNGSRTVSVSYSGGTSSSVQTTGNHLRGENALLIWSAGNGGNRVTGSDHADVIIVSASDQNDNVTSWSTYGKWVDVAAPGEGIRTTTNGGGTGSVSGTSFSAPIVNGVCAMMMVNHPSATAAQIESLLYSTCVDIEGAGEDNRSGHGRPNFFRALREATEAEWGVTNTIELTGPESVVAGQSVSYGITGAPANARYEFRYSFENYGSVVGGQRSNLSGNMVTFGAGTTDGAGTANVSQNVPVNARGLRVYVEAFALDNGVVTDSNFVILDIL